MRFFIEKKTSDKLYIVSRALVAIKKRLYVHLRSDFVDNFEVLVSISSLNIKSLKCFDKILKEMKVWFRKQ